MGVLNGNAELWKSGCVRQLRHTMYTTGILMYEANDSIRRVYQ